VLTKRQLQYKIFSVYNMRGWGMLSLRHFLDCFFVKGKMLYLSFFYQSRIHKRTIELEWNTKIWIWIYHIEIFQYFITFCWRFLLLKTCSLVLLTLTVNFHTLQYDRNIFSDDFLIVYYQFYKKRKYFLSSYRTRFTIIIHIINYSKYYIVIKFFLEISSATNVQ
jgi:hypothetical protein